MVVGYYKLVTLPTETKEANKIKSNTRLDCILFAGNYKGLTNFVNKKGQLFFYKTPCTDIIKVNNKKVSEWNLNNNSLNFSSIYIEKLNFPCYAYGYPNGKLHLSNRTKNPLYEFRNDGYLFLINTDYTEIEVLIIQDGKNSINQYYQNLIKGDLKTEIQKLRIEAKPFFEYLNFDSANSKLLPLTNSINYV